MANNFHDINGLLIVGIEGHSGFHIFPPAPMWFWKINLLHPFVLGDKAKPTVLMNGVPSVTHEHEPKLLWPHLGIIPDPLDAMTPLHILMGSQKCWLPRLQVEICGETSTCCVVGGPISLNADCWEVGMWPTSLVVQPGTVQTTPTPMDYLMGTVGLAINAIIDYLAGKAMDFGIALIGRGLRRAVRAIGPRLRGLGLNLRARFNLGRCRLFGEPVDVATGLVVDQALDLAVPGPVALEWTRSLASDRGPHRTCFGYGGWTANWEQWIELDPDTGELRYHDDEGRIVTLPRLEGESPGICRAERLEVQRAGSAIVIERHDGRRLTFEHSGDDRWRLEQLRVAGGRVLSLEYGATGLAAVSEGERQLRVERRPDGRVVRVAAVVAGRELRSVAYEYSARMELSAVRWSDGPCETFVYDADHWIVSKRLRNGLAFHFEYDAEGRCLRTYGDDGSHAATFEYDDPLCTTTVVTAAGTSVARWSQAGAILEESTPAAGTRTRYLYDGDGLLLQRSDGPGRSTTFEYDERGNLTAETDGLGARKSLSYEGFLLVAIAYANGELATLQYDDQGRPIRMEDASGTTSLEHGPFGPTRIVGPGEVASTFEYDPRGRLAATIRPDGGVVRYEYDSFGRQSAMVDPLGRRSEAEYDANDGVARLCRDGTLLVQCERDNFGALSWVDGSRVVPMRLAYGGTGVVREGAVKGRSFAVERDVLERPTRIVNDRGVAHSLSYDEAGRVKEEVTFDGRTRRVRYGAAGLPEEVTESDGRVTRVSYDARGLVTAVDAGATQRAFRRDHRGRLVYARSAGNGIHETRIKTVDGDPLLVSEHQDQRAIERRYDARGRLLSKQLPSGRSARFEYDWSGAVTAVELSGVRLELRHDAAGRLAAIATHQAVLARYEYDAADRVIAVQSGARGLLRHEFTFDASGKLLSSVEGGLARRLQYEDGRLVAEESEGETRRFGDSIEGTGCHVTAAFRKRYAHDAGGRRVLEEGTAGDVRYQWDELDQLGGVARGGGFAKYEYDALGRRVRFTLSGDRPVNEAYVWDGDVVAEVYRDDVLHQSFVHLPGSVVPLLQQDADGQVVAVVCDGFGSALALVDPHGTVRGATSWSANGDRRPIAGHTWDTPLGLAGHYEDASGMHHTRYRQYDPSSMSWLSPDPLGLYGGFEITRYDGVPLFEPDPYGLLTCGNILPGTAEYFEYKTILAQGFNHNEAVDLMNQFRNGINPDGKWAFHFTNLKGAEGILSSGEIWATHPGIRVLIGSRNAVYAGTTPTPSWWVRSIPGFGWGLTPGTSSRVPIYMPNLSGVDVQYPWHKLFTAVFGHGESLVLWTP